MTIKNKGHTLSSELCSNCGRPRELQRINGRYIMAELASVMSFEKGFFFTIRELLLHPGLSVRRFVVEDRSRFVKPIIFIIVCSLTYSFLQQATSFEDGYVNYTHDDWRQSTTGAIFDWVSKNYGYANIIMIVFIAAWVKFFFRKHPYSYYEVVILLCFTMGMAMLMFAAFGAAESVTGIPLLQIGANIAFLYNAWAIGQFFDKARLFNYVKGLLAYILGFVTFVVVALFTGTLIDMLLK